MKKNFTATIDKSELEQILKNYVGSHEDFRGLYLKDIVINFSQGNPSIGEEPELRDIVLNLNVNKERR